MTDDQTTRTAQRRERVVPRLLEEEMRESFLGYSMSVIVQRALPDVKDGLKPVHRRILYAMHELGLQPNRPYKKSAAVVGEVLGKYHPHGDAAVYDAMVRMVQDFSLRYPLIDGQGNFGSIDGDSAAAYRYTEAKIAEIAVELLRDIEKETVDFSPTFDDQREEPIALPARIPNLLVNGSSGIAVGMATNIPPHNLREVVSALELLIDEPDCTLDELMERMPGPDFPTGGFIMGAEGIRKAYETGRGRMIMRARVQRETKRGGRAQLVVTELPYGISKSKVIEQIADLVRTRKVEDVADLRDESDREGMRIVIELKRGAKVQPVLNALYKQTYLQATFGAILIALDEGVPREMSLKQMLERYRDHRIDVIRRRSEHELENARDEAHITEGLLVALDNIDEVIALIRKAEDRDDASEKLQARFELSEKQADAILNMRLARLTALETIELKNRLEELQAEIERLEKLLGSRKRQLALLMEELNEMVERFGDARRTSIVRADAEIDVADMIAQEDVVITLSHEGYMKRIPMSLYKRRVTSGKPLAGMEKYETDFLEHVFIASTHDTLLFFTRQGQVHALDVHEVPEAGRSSRGRSLRQLLELGDDTVAGLLAVSEFVEDRFVVFLTRDGTVKRTTLDQFANVRAGGINAINVKDGDALLDVHLSDGTNDIVLVTSGGRAIRFPERDISVLGRTAQGVRGIKLRKDDAVVGMVLVKRDATLCTITELGYAKRTPVAEYPAQKRGGLGSVTLKVSKRTGPLVAAKELLPDDELMVMAASGSAARISGEEIPMQGRNTQGKRIVRLGDGDRVVEVSRVAQGETGGGDKSGGGEQIEMIAAAGE